MTTTSPRPSVPAAPSAARLRPSDLAGLASIGLRTRKLRAGLSALGIAIGVAAIVAVLGLAASAKQGLLTEIARLGTNLLTVTNGQTFSGATAELPVTAPGMLDRLPGVTDVQDTGTVNGVSAYKSPLIPKIETNAISVDAVTPGLPDAAGTGIAQGRFLNAATARQPVVVLGAEAAQLLGIDRVRPGIRIWVGPGGPSGQWFYVTGILNQPGKPQPGHRLPPLGRPHRTRRNRGRPRHPVPRPWCCRPPGRRDRCRQHHDHLRA